MEAFERDIFFSSRRVELSIENSAIVGSLLELLLPFVEEALYLLVLRVRKTSRPLFLTCTAAAAPPPPAVS